MRVTSLRGSVRHRFPWSRLSACFFGATVALLLMNVIGCHDEEPYGCPAVHSYLDTVFHVVSVRDATTGVAIDTVVVGAATVNAQPYWLEVAQYDDNASGVQLVGDSLVCVPPFGFGTQSGRWVLTLSARGYPTQAVEFDAAYAVFQGGCGSYNDSGSVVSLEMNQAR